MASNRPGPPIPEQLDGDISVTGIDEPTAPPDSATVIRKRWLELPAAILIVVVVLAMVLPAPPAGTRSDSIPAAGDLGVREYDDVGGVAIATPATPAPVASAPTTVATPIPQPAERTVPATPTTAAAAPLDVSELEVPPDELGGVPVIMYHAFTSDPAYVDEWTLTFDTFREQLDWYREHDFVMVSVQDMIDGTFDVPAGKTPIIVTFDDASSGQFGLREVPGGGYEVKPNTAVGILEEYRERYPEFVGPAFFAVLTWNCFGSDDDPSTCEERLNWLVDHGYEVGNHTLDHVDMTDVDDAFFKHSIAGMVDWINQRLPAGEGNYANVLVMPFGAYPDPELHPEQRSWLADGFWYEGEEVTLPIVFTVNGGPAIPPYAMNAYPSVTFRIAADPGILGYWQEAMLSGEAPVFVSDGDPGTITIPAWAIDRLDEVWAADHGLEVRTYEPSATGS